MKYAWILLLLFFFNAPSFSQESSGGALLFLPQEDEMSLKSLQQSADEGVLDADLFYNLGVLYLEEGDLGHAVLNMKRASLLSPKDEEVKEALRSLRLSVGVPSYALEGSPLGRFFLYPFLVLPLNFMFLLSVTLFFATGILSSFSLSEKRPHLRLRRWSVSLMMVFGFFVIASTVRYHLTFSPKLAVCISDSVLFEEASPEAETELSLSAGSECKVLESSGEYVLISSGDGSYGWVSSDHLETLWQ